MRKPLTEARRLRFTREMLDTGEMSMRTSRHRSSFNRGLAVRLWLCASSTRRASLASRSWQDLSHTQMNRQCKALPAIIALLQPKHKVQSSIDDHVSCAGIWSSKDFETLSQCLLRKQMSTLRWVCHLSSDIPFSEPAYFASWSQFIAWNALHYRVTFLGL